MEEALRKRLVLLTFIPLLLVVAVLLGALWLTLAWVPSSVWVASKGLETEIMLGALAIAAIFVVVELVVLLRTARIAGRGIRNLLKVTETAKIPQSEIPGALREDVEFSVLAKRLEQLSKSAKTEVAASRRLVRLEEELQRIANAIEEVSVGSPFVPLSEKDGGSGRIASLLNKVLPEFCGLRRSSVKEIQAVENELRETRKASQELAAHAEKGFVESTEALVAAREVSKLATEVGDKLQALPGKRGERIDRRLYKEEIRDAVTRVIETAARGIEELTKGLMSSTALSASAERIANRASVLALNVAVESAKASLPGMNVLAEEIRKLAEFARACSDESTILIRDIETKVDSVVRTIHISQEEVRLRIRSLGIAASDERVGEDEAAGVELDQVMSRFGEAAARLLTKVQELSRLTERTSRDAERMSRRVLAAHDQTAALVEDESWKSPSGESESLEIETLSDDDFLVENPAADKQEGD